MLPIPCTALRCQLHRESSGPGRSGTGRKQSSVWGKKTLFSMGKGWGLLNRKPYLQASVGCWRGVGVEGTQCRGEMLPTRTRRHA